MYKLLKYVTISLLFFFIYFFIHRISNKPSQSETFADSKRFNSPLIPIAQGPDVDKANDFKDDERIDELEKAFSDFQEVFGKQPRVKALEDKVVMQGQLINQLTGIISDMNADVKNTKKGVNDMQKIMVDFEQKIKNLETPVVDFSK